MADPQHLNTLLAAVRKIEGVFDVPHHRREGFRGAATAQNVMLTNHISR